MLSGISMMVGVKDWLGDEINETLDELTITPEGADGDSELDWPWGVSDADGGVVSLPTTGPKVKSLENEVDVVDEFVVFVVRGLCEALPVVGKDDVAGDGIGVSDEGRATGVGSVVRGICEALPDVDEDSFGIGVADEGRATDGRVSIDFSVERVVVALDSTDAAPGPLPTAGTEPTCLVGAAMEGPPSVGDDIAAVGDGFDAVEEGRAADGEGLVTDVVRALDSMEAAPGPLPTAGTEPTCFEGRMVETEAACASGRGFGSSEGVNVGRVEAAAAELSLVDPGRCFAAAAGMED